MPASLTPAGEAKVAELAQRYRVSEPAVRTLVDAVTRGGGAMAQFSHPELGGSGQWMRGGMTMVGDMFNPGLQATVSGICAELSAQLTGGGPPLVSQPKTPASPGGSSQAGFDHAGASWWPAEFGRPSTSGGQNDDAYAYFPGPARLAIRRGPQVTVYDTGEHVITGVQQQQGGRGSVEFSSQFGSFTVDSLHQVDVAEAGPARPDEPARATPPSSAPISGRAGDATEIGAAIETLAGLRDKGFLTADEFTAKKTELLDRL